MKINWTFLIIIVVNLVFATVGDTAAKMWAVHPGQKWFWIALGISIVTSITFMLVVRQGGLAIGSTIALLLTIVSTTCIGFFIFGEKIHTIQWLGIGLGLIAITLILEVFKLE